ncbi:MAG: pentose kinase [Eubacterium sp.]|jgi:xylulokinase|nr:pentose kinase [Eubacterium sp.]
MNKLISYDLGTGGIKASIISDSGKILEELFLPYETTYPHDKWCEQRPMDWWQRVCESTSILLKKSGVKSSELACAAVSGHSIVAAPFDESGNLLLESVPIWCDMRAGNVLTDFFSNVPYERWYSTTGNGDPAECYSIMKLMWMKKHQPDIYDKTAKILGSKDFINYMLTGEMGTDPSYAASFGVFNLIKWDYEQEFFKAAGIRREIFPDIFPSDSVIGKVTENAAEATGLPAGLPVACGGVDNMCMALGAVGTAEGRVYTSLGSSSWIAVNSKTPIIDIKTRPFVYAHAQKGMYTSAVSIFSAGNSYRWLHDTLFSNMSFKDMDKLAEKTAPGAGGVMFNPTLAGGSAQEPSPNMQGAFVGLSLGTTGPQIIRACMEGVAMSLNAALEILKTHTQLDNRMLLCGGGSKSALWRRIFADVYSMDIIKTNVDQGAATLGAAALAGNSVGIWNGYNMIDSFHNLESVEEPNSKNTAIYKEMFEIFNKLSAFVAEIGDDMAKMRVKK